jgi:hypothetical protein
MPSCASAEGRTESIGLHGAGRCTAAGAGAHRLSAGRFPRDSACRPARTPVQVRSATRRTVARHLRGRRRPDGSLVRIMPRGRASAVRRASCAARNGPTRRRRQHQNVGGRHRRLFVLLRTRAPERTARSRSAGLPVGEFTVAASKDPRRQCECAPAWGTGAFAAL